MANSNLLDGIIDATSGGAQIISEENDFGKITPAAPRFDPGEYAATAEEAVRRANLNAANGKVAVMSVGEVPWHGLGTVIDRAATSTEAIQFANLGGWDLTKLPQYVDIAGEWVQSGAYAIVRSDTGAVLGTVGSRYQIVTNEECFDFLDAVIESGARYETAGALGKGEHVWLLARMPERTVVADDELENFIMFSTSHDGTSSVHCHPTSVRAVCQNTYRLAIGDRKKGLHFRHTGNVKANVQAAQKMLGLATRQMELYQTHATHLAGVQVEPQEYFGACLDDIVQATVADQTVTTAALKGRSILDAIAEMQDAEARATEEVKLERVLTKRGAVLDEILERYESNRNSGNPAIAGTGWAAVNAITEYADHSPQMRYQGSDQQRAERRFTSVLTGRADEIKQQAFVRALDMTI